MINLLSIISSLGLGASSIAPLVEVSSNTKEVVINRTTNLNIVDRDYYVFNTFPYYIANL